VSVHSFRWQTFHFAITTYYLKNSNKPFFLTFNSYLMFHTKVVVMFMVFLHTKFCMFTPTAQDVININCRDAVLQSTPKGMLFFTYALTPKLSGIYVHVLSNYNVTTTSDVRTAQGPLLASFILNFIYDQSLWFKPVPMAVRSKA
jgi:hypothetical protein